jgi:anti-anti-sigma factor
MSQLALHGQVAAWDTSEDGVVTVTFQGELDAITASAITGYLARITQEMPRVMVFDLAEVGFLDCTAARTLIETGHELPSHPRLVLRHPRPVVRRLLSLIGVNV